jgi:hypothetical protein
VLTGLDLNLGTSAGRTPVAGALVERDIHMNTFTPDGSITVIRDSLSALTDFDNETLFSMGLIMREPGLPTALRPTLGIYMPAVKIGNIRAPFLGGDGAKVETREIFLHPTVGDSVNDAASIIFYSSAA